MSGYTVVVFPAGGDAYRTYGQYHAAERDGHGGYRSVCGRKFSSEDYHADASEPHKITCGRCCDRLAAQALKRAALAEMLS